MSGGRVLFLSAYHDYRTAKRASIHQTAHALARAGYDVSFVSTRFSHLSKRKGDSRLFLWERANRFEEVDGVRCYLWRTAFHPFATGSPLADQLMTGLFPLYAALPNREIDGVIRAADFVVIESSVAAILLRRIRRLNPRCRLIYYATDRLDTVGAHPFVRAQLVRDAALIDHVSLRSSTMAEDFDWAGGRLRRVGFGIDPADFAGIGASPYTGGQNAVAVGSMLFDAGFFRLAAPLFPDVTFHVIGCGEQFDAPGNVQIHDEMPFRATLPWLAHSDIGVAPYRAAPGVEYLAESSLKLAQYEFLRLPAVCPNFAVGGVASRCGYQPDDAGSIRAAVECALALAGTLSPRSFPTWEEVGERLLRPDDYPDTALPA